MNETLVRNALREMLKAGATQQEIADKAGLSQNCISRFLNGNNDISFSRGLKIMRVIQAAQTATASQSMGGEEPAGEETSPAMSANGDQEGKPE